MPYLPGKALTNRFSNVGRRALRVIQKYQLNSYFVILLIQESHLPFIFPLRSEKGVISHYFLCFRSSRLCYQFFCHKLFSLFLFYFIFFLFFFSLQLYQINCKQHNLCRSIFPLFLVVPQTISHMTVSQW